eukprot:UN28822
MLFAIMGFRYQFLMFGVLTAFMTIPSIIIWYKFSDCFVVEHHEVEQKMDLRKIMHKGTIVAMSVTFFAYFSFGIVEPLLEPHLSRVLQLTPLQIGFAYILQAGVPAVVAPWIGILNEKYDARYFLILGYVLETIMYFFFGPTPFLIPFLDTYTSEMINQLLCLFLLGCGAALLLTSSFVFLSYQVMQPGVDGSEEMSSSLFIFLEGISCALAP